MVHRKESNHTEQTRAPSSDSKPLAAFEDNRPTFAIQQKLKNTIQRRPQPRLTSRTSAPIQQQEMSSKEPMEEASPLVLTPAFPIQKKDNHPPIQRVPDERKIASLEQNISTLLADVARDTGLKKETLRQQTSLAVRIGSLETQIAGQEEIVIAQDRIIGAAEIEEATDFSRGAGTALDRVTAYERRRDAPGARTSAQQIKIQAEGVIADLRLELQGLQQEKVGVDQRVGDLERSIQFGMRMVRSSKKEMIIENDHKDDVNRIMNTVKLRNTYTEEIASLNLILAQLPGERARLVLQKATEDARLKRAREELVMFADSTYKDRLIPEAERKERLATAAIAELDAEIVELDAKVLRLTNYRDQKIIDRDGLSGRITAGNVELNRNINSKMISSDNTDANHQRIMAQINRKFRKYSGRSYAKSTRIRLVQKIVDEYPELHPQINVLHERIFGDPAPLPFQKTPMSGVERFENNLDNLLALRWGSMGKESSPISKGHWGHQLVHFFTRMPFTPIVLSWQLLKDFVNIRDNYSAAREELGNTLATLKIANNIVKKVAAIASWSALICTLLAFIPHLQFFGVAAPILGMIAFWAHIAQIATSSALALGLKIVSNRRIQKGLSPERMKFHQRQAYVDMLMGTLGALSGGLFGAGGKMLNHGSAVISGMGKGATIGSGAAVGPGAKAVTGKVAGAAIKGGEMRPVMQRAEGDGKEEASPIDAILSQITDLENAAGFTKLNRKEELTATKEEAGNLEATEKDIQGLRKNGKVGNIDSVVAKGKSAIDQDEEMKINVTKDESQAAAEEAKVATIEDRVDYIENQEGRSVESVHTDEMDGAKTVMNRLEVAPKPKRISNVRKFFRRLSARLFSVKARVVKLKNRVTEKIQTAFMDAIGLNQKIKAFENSVEESQKAMPEKIDNLKASETAATDFFVKVSNYKKAVTTEKAKEESK